MKWYQWDDSGIKSAQTSYACRDGITSSNSTCVTIIATQPSTGLSQYLNNSSPPIFGTFSLNKEKFLQGDFEIINKAAMSYNILDVSQNIRDRIATSPCSPRMASIMWQWVPFLVQRKERLSSIQLTHTQSRRCGSCTVTVNSSFSNVSLVDVIASDKKVSQKSKGCRANKV